jgi:uncharacterized OB-fold protein
MAITPVTRDADAAEFFDAARRGVFLLGRRRSTGQYIDPATVAQQPDDPDLEYAPAGGAGRVVSWATVRSRADDSDEPVRTVVSIVELDEGPWWWTQLQGVSPDDDLRDLRVHVAFAASGAGDNHELVPVFQPAASDTTTQSPARADRQ